MTTSFMNVRNDYGKDDYGEGCSFKEAREPDSFATVDEVETHY